MGHVVDRANERLREAAQAPLPRLSPHSLRRTFESVKTTRATQSLALSAKTKPGKEEGSG
jgi:integrase